MPILDAASAAPLRDKLLHIASRSGTDEFHHQFRQLDEIHGREEIHRAADELEQDGLIEWPDRGAPATLAATAAGHAEVARFV